MGLLEDFIMEIMMNSDENLFFPFELIKFILLALGYYENKFRVMLITTLSLRSIFIWDAKISIFDIFYLFIFIKARKQLRLTKRYVMFMVFIA